LAAPLEEEIVESMTAVGQSQKQHWDS